MDQSDTLLVSLLNLNPYDVELIYSVRDDSDHLSPTLMPSLQPILKFLMILSLLLWNFLKILDRLFLP